MPRYFFTTNDGWVFHRDDDGHNLANLGKAKHLALECLPDVARDKLATDNDRLV